MTKRADEFIVKRMREKVETSEVTGKDISNGVASLKGCDETNESLRENGISAGGQNVSDSFCISAQCHTLYPSDDCLITF